MGTRLSTSSNRRPNRFVKWLDETIGTSLPQYTGNHALLEPVCSFPWRMRTALGRVVHGHMQRHAMATAIRWHSPQFSSSQFCFRTVDRPLIVSADVLFGILGTAGFSLLFLYCQLSELASVGNRAQIHNFTL